MPFWNVLLREYSWKHWVRCMKEQWITAFERVQARILITKPLNQV